VNVYLVRSYDRDLDPMTLIFDLDLGVLKLYVPSRNEVSRARLSKVRCQTGLTQTDRLMRPTHYHAAFAGGNHSRWSTMVLIDRAYTTSCN